MNVLYTPLIAAAVLAAAAAAGAQAQTPGTEAPRVITYIEVAPSAADAAADLLWRAAAASRKEAGSLRYEILQLIERRGQFAILEAWHDAKAFEAHDGGAAAKALRGGLDPLRVGFYDQRLETAIDIDPAPAPASKDAIYVATHVDVTGQFKDDAIVMMKKIAAESRKQAGAERYEVWQQNNRLNHFTVVEVWKDQGALDAHNVSAPAREYREQLGRMMGALYDDRRYRNLE
ncbi:MAG TPA: antibiotic biosynthesis monooxygenase [Xanthobacteraceae bacterium]